MRRKDFIRTSIFSLLGFIFFRNEVYSKSEDESIYFKPNPSLWKDDEINIAWIGHSTVLINFFGLKILTDPVLYERVGLYFLGITWGPSRFTHPALTIDEIPEPDIILLSHAHMDHMDYQTLLDITTKFPDKIDCLTAFNTMDVIADLKWKSLQEIDWNEEIMIRDIRFKAYEVQHFGWRYPWERDRSKGFFEDGRSYNAYLISYKGKNILFGGDTAMTDKFKDVKEKIEIAIMPIGAYRPWRKNHCNPEEALIMATEHLKAKYFIPIHTKTFKQGTEPITEPLSWLKESSKNYSINLVIDDIGQTFTIKET
ncbi:MAG: MBL fold metallo-hydrolase [Ignavibacterium sp.]|uniref:MBL fold metallo-hydrolase n=1 Tax=Ignavibacterium sp. TaxID=2651167 RepID=UPI00329A40E7